MRRFQDTRAQWTHDVQNSNQKKNLHSDYDDSADLKKKEKRKSELYGSPDDPHMKSSLISNF